ncbi:beta-ketoacyl-[acyl-carrier-protein] synthase family protein [Streptomyces roseoverticillatus]|uniref:beta-ketoacyl-[acyl-carrier-protein] synthase family protein n=1 Tax=Streptomyces roseoverticillatus TaxID=66429 RepID=UPI001F16E6AB|nr:beta-ketoacyl-[acyl-carrier-protein] synthase family protein [Streptomyces roseoverticillatus]MCF3106781.1 beta-ketoacyl-[acyl-carrier-protein] synthase family protein [Streptomyces roseoverticillatus]
MTRRVAVTGIGPVTPIGIGVKTFEESLWEGRSGIGPLTRFHLDGFPVHAVGEVRDFEPRDHLDERLVRRAERFAQFGVAAGRLAVEDAGDPVTGLDPERGAVVVATAYAGMERVPAETDVLRRRGWRAVSPTTSMAMMPSVAAGLLSMELGLMGPVECPATGCAASGHALSRGAELIRQGLVDVALAGGCDAPLNPVSLATFATARALSTRPGDPSTACRPFDAERDGFVMSEGGVVLVLEEWERARARGARVYAELAGHGHTADAHNLSRPRPDGRGALNAMRLALRAAGREPAEVGYVNAHAAGTAAGDPAEVLALRQLIGERLPPVSSTKSMHGHLMGGTAAAEAAATALALHRGLLPPTINYRNVDPDCAVDVVPGRARKADVELALSNSFALGGINCSLVLAKA